MAHSPTCTSRYEEIGVQFKLVPLTNADFIEALNDEGDKRRSQLAHECFGTADAIVYMADPLTSQPPTMLVERLRNGVDPRLTDCDVPLAVLQFQESKIQFVDVWSVRRPCVPGQRPDVFLTNDLLTSSALTMLAGPQRAIEGISFLFQFQNQLEELRTTGEDAQKVEADQHFVYLPAAGLLPSGENAALTHLFNYNTFFDVDLEPCQLLQLEPAYVRSLIHDSFYAEPIEVNTDMKVDLYRVGGSDQDNDPLVLFVRRVPLALDSCPQRDSRAGARTRTRGPHR